jgi:lipoprotein-anchoring transpeptidase ErfK/SrfK
MAAKELTEKEKHRRSFLITTAVLGITALIIAEVVAPADPVAMTVATAVSVSIAVLISYTVTYIAKVDIAPLVGYRSSSKVLDSQINNSEIAVTYDWVTGGLELTVDRFKFDDTNAIRRVLLTYILVALVSGAVIGYAIAGGF